MISLDRDAMTPLYVQLANVLRDRIRNGEIPVGRRLPSQSELEEETGGTVSRRTIKTALEVLAAEGLVQGVQGKGVFVIALPAPAEE
ncbi:GntR family transcriptional regulator [Streptomyces ossamyceticus]|uniref:GntR family transcriptional regulator n=1 Tax=Streptomyces ossamyceticus TaxID=249581 RepID=UPI00343AC618